MYDATLLHTSNMTAVYNYRRQNDVMHEDIVIWPAGMVKGVFCFRMVKKQIQILRFYVTLCLLCLTYYCGL